MEPTNCAAELTTDDCLLTTSMLSTILLFDIDGTLCVPAPGRGYRREVRRALEEVFGTAGRIDEVRFDGKTDLAILREALECEGITPAEVRERLAEWERVFVRLTTRLGAEAPLFVACPGTAALLDHLAADARYLLSVLTGNLEPMAAVKLASVGFDRYFSVRGAYGSDHEDRNALPAIASERICRHLGCALAPEQFVIVGDTPRDIAAARAFGTRVLAVATGHYDVDQLAAHRPDAVLPDLSDLEAVLAVLS